MIRAETFDDAFDDSTIEEDWSATNDDILRKEKNEESEEPSEKASAVDSVMESAADSFNYDF